MLVNIQGKPVPVRLGSGFPVDSKVDVRSMASDERRDHTEWSRQFTRRRLLAMCAGPALAPAIPSLSSKQ